VKLLANRIALLKMEEKKVSYINLLPKTSMMLNHFVIIIGSQKDRRYKEEGKGYYAS
jgi:hypothetical protein